MELKKLHYILIIGFVAALATSLFFTNFRTTEISIETAGVEVLKSKFSLLSNAGTNFCAGPDFISSIGDSERLQGSCCSPMDFHMYAEQVDGLKKYSDIRVIPSDPYDIPVSLAKELLKYQKSIQLTAEEQSIYDEAMKTSHEGGPCCCKCWRWYAFEGQAKYLITQYNFNSQQIAEVWGLEDGCGGSGHAGHEMEIDERKTFEPQS